MDQPNNTPPPAPAPAQDAADIAAAALKAAQQSVSNLQQEAGVGGGGAPDPLAAAQAAIAHARAANAPGAQGPGAQPLNMPAFTPQSGAPRPEGIDLLADVNLHVKIELGRTRMLVEDVLRLGEGSVVELDKLAGDPVDVYVNDRHVAKGEVLVLNDNFCVRINEIVAVVGEPPASR